MICTKCNFNNSADAKFCEKCGNPLTGVETVEIKCNRCGKTFSENTTFCDACGNKFGQAEKPDRRPFPPSPDPYMPMPPTYPWFGVILFFLIPYGIFAGIRHVIRAARVRHFYKNGQIAKAYECSEGLKMHFYIQLFLSAVFTVAVIILICT